MFMRNSGIVIATVAATSLAVVVGNYAGRRVRTAEEWERIYARVPPKDAAPPGQAPPVELQPVVDTFDPNPFLGRVTAKPAPTEEHAKRMQELKRSEGSFETIRDGAYLLAWAIPALAAFLLWHRWRRQRYLDLMHKEIELEMVRQGGTDNEPSADSRPCTPDGPGDSGSGEELPLRVGTSGCLGAILHDLQDGPGEVRSGAGEDAAPAPANE
jgi:hypothetical protein